MDLHLQSTLSFREKALIKSFTYKTPTTLSMDSEYTGNLECPLVAIFSINSSSGVERDKKSTSMRGIITSFTEVSDKSSIPFIISRFSSFKISSCSTSLLLE